MKKKLCLFCPFTTHLLFGVAMFFFWLFFYPNHLGQKEQMQIFLWDWGYLSDHLCLQGGLAIWLGELFTQFFMYPWMGAIVVGATIFSIPLSLQKILNKLFGTRFSALPFLPAIAYCVLLFNDFYRISGALAIAGTLWCVVFCLNQTRPIVRFMSETLLIPLLYWLLGGAYIPFLLAVFFAEIILKVKKEQKTQPFGHLLGASITLFITGIIVPLAARRFFIVDSMLQSFFSPAFYKFTLIFPTPLKFILFLTPVVIPLQWLLNHILPTKNENHLQYGLIALLLFVLIGCFYFFPNWEEEKEMKYDNLVARQEWDKIVCLAEKAPPTGKQGRMALMLALGKTGQLSTRLFSFQPQLDDFFVPYEMHGMAPLIASEPYYYLGLVNFSQMLAMETIESTADAVMPVRAVKRFAETCIITGQYDVAAKYLGYLKKTLFYRQWAKTAAQCLSDEKVNLHPVWGELRKKQVKDQFYFPFDETKDIALICLLRSDPRNKLAFEYLMSSCLLRKNFDDFLKFLPLVKTMGYSGVPLVYQEALAYVETMLPKVPEELLQIHIDDDVSNRIMLYAKAFKNGGNKDPQQMKKLFGNTYWYYVHFSSKK